MTPSDHADANAVEPTFKQRVISGSAWTFGQHGASLALRFVSQWILRYLLFPGAFGVMMVVDAFLHGLVMLSDVGLNASIVQHPKGDEPVFLRTTWTLQIVRGWILGLLACLFVWPVATFYDDTSLLWFLPVAAFSLVIDGFKSYSTRTIVD